MSSFLSLVRSGRSVLGCFAFTSSPAIIEMIALAGFDYVVIDMEHSAKSWPDVENLVRSAEVRGMPALVRVAENSESDIRIALECGADGIVVPGIGSVDDASKAFQAMRFSPVGLRGACPLSRAASYGPTDYSAFTDSSNKERALVLLIEDISAARSISDIMATVDENVCYMVGRSDLASSLGLLGNPGQATVVEAARQFVADVKACQPEAAVGMGLYSPSEIAMWKDEGCKFFWYGADVSIFLQAARRIVQELRS